MGLAIALIVFKGSSSDGQTSPFSSLLSSYIEETAASVTNGSPSHQLADMNSVFAYSGVSNRVANPSIISMVQNNSVVSQGSILTDIIDEFSDKSTEITSYEVQEGDSLSLIATDFGIKLNTIIWANNLKNANSISPGTILKIPPIDGVIHKVRKGDTINTVASKYGAETAKIIEYNNLPLDGTIQIGTDIIVPDGKIKGSTAVAQSANTTKRFSYLPDYGGYFALPATGFNWGRIHGRNGVDVANACGTPIYATADGTISLAKNTGWNGGFGKYIKMSHPNGTESLYGHLSKILVSVGETVKKNQQIALMGTTGNSTGCHIHFEVHGGKNPLSKY
jgi:LysM repeat protein